MKARGFLISKKLTMDKDVYPFQASYNYVQGKHLFPWGIFCIIQEYINFPVKRIHGKKGKIACTWVSSLVGTGPFSGPRVNMKKVTSHKYRGEGKPAVIGR